MIIFDKKPRTDPNLPTGGFGRYSLKETPAGVIVHECDVEDGKWKAQTIEVDGITHPNKCPVCDMTAGEFIHLIYNAPAEIIVQMWCGYCAERDDSRWVDSEALVAEKRPVERVCYEYHRGVLKVA